MKNLTVVLKFPLLIIKINSAIKLCFVMTVFLEENIFLYHTQLIVITRSSISEVIYVLFLFQDLNCSLMYE